MITSVSNEKIKELIKLKQKKYRIENKKFLIEGYHLVEEAYKKGILIEVFSVKAENYPNSTLISENVLRKLTFSKSPQKIVGVCQFFNNQYESDKILVLDNINDPGNFGTLLRTALAFGYKRIIVSEDTCDQYNDKVIRSSQGAIFNVQIIRGNLPQLLKKLENFKIIGATLNGEFQRPSREKIALVLGNESQGINSEVLKCCQQLVSIEVAEVESLNVAAAGSILMHSFK